MRLGTVQEQHLENAESAGVGPRADDARRQFAPREILLHDRGLPEPAQQRLARIGERADRDVTCDAANIPRLVPPASGFTNSGNGRSTASTPPACSTTAKGG